MHATKTPATDFVTLREQFPLLNQKLGAYDLVYFDNAATNQKPIQVIEAIDQYYRLNNSNIHRGVHQIATRATEAFEETRGIVREFINATRKEEIIFTSGTTDAINLVAQTWGRAHIQQGDEILISALEHHSNIVPWQLLAQEKGAVIRIIPVTPSGEWDLSTLHELLNQHTKLVAVNHVSNALGTVNPVKQLIESAKTVGALVLLDGAQAVSHFKVDVQELGCDFYCFSGHKIYGPTGTGVLYGRYELLESMPPWKGGGEMIDQVSFSGTTFQKPPYRFEAGTPHIAGVIGLGAAIRFAESLDWAELQKHESGLLRAATERLLGIPELKIYGTSKDKVAVISFLIDGIHPYDIGTLLDHQGIAVRSGHHCTQPLWDQYGIPGTVRISFAPYNTLSEIEKLELALHKAVQMLKS